jgi:two-component system CheB/CheR fusion protein
MSSDAAAVIDPTDLDHLLHRLLDQTQDHATLLLDREGRIVWWSCGAEHVFGMKAEEVIGRPASLIFTPEDIERGLADHELVTARAGTSADDDRWLKRGDGTRFWATGVMIGLRDDDGRLIGFGKILRDRTDTREQMDTLRNQLVASEARSRRKDIFLTTLSHELRGPLAPLSHAVQLIRMTLPATPEVEYSLKVIERQVQSLRRLVDDLLDLSRISAGKIALRKETIALDQVIDWALESVGPLIRQRGHRLEKLLPPTPVNVEADPARLEQVFVNLLTNAAKYTPENGTIWIKTTIEGDEVVTHVQDSGIGIAPELLPRIFELFTQAESAGADSHGGLGIGLALAKDLVALHGGSIQVLSEGENKGSDFIVRLPLKP